MKISLDNFSLAEGGDASPQGLRLAGANGVQTATYLRAKAAAHFDRGNIVNTLTFSVTREHASYAAAQAFLFSHAAAMPTNGLLKVTSEAFEGTITNFGASASVVSGREGAQEGITTTHQYTVLCGPLTGGSIGLAGSVGGYTGNLGGGGGGLQLD